MKNRYAMTDTQSELCALAEKYADAYDELNKRFTDVPPEEIVYGRGGVCFHRGPFLPSPVFDLIIGNANRGRTVAKPRKPESCDWHFYFSGGQLVVAEKYADDFEMRLYSREFILREEQCELGLTFHVLEPFPHALSFVSLCRYHEEGKIASYATLTVSQKDFHEERYSYQRDGLIESFTFNDTLVYNGIQTRQLNYRILHDENGIVTAYESENGHVYEVQRGKQRRI